MPSHPAQLSYFSRGPRGGLETESKNSDIQGTNCGHGVYVYNKYTAKISRVNQNTSSVTAIRSGFFFSRFLYLYRLKTSRWQPFSRSRISCELHHPRPLRVRRHTPNLNNNSVTKDGQNYRNTTIVERSSRSKSNLRWLRENFELYFDMNEFELVNKSIAKLSFRKVFAGCTKGQMVVIYNVP